MKFMSNTAAFIVIATFAACAAGAADHASLTNVRQNQMVIELCSNDEKLARNIAEEYDMQYVRALDALPNYFVFTSNAGERDSIRSKRHSHNIREDTRIVSSAVQTPKKRVKRDDFIPNQHAIQAAWPTEWSDPLYPSQWYLEDNRELPHSHTGGMRVREAWSLGYSGRGVTVSVLDDGLQINHPDIALNYDPRASTDLNGNDDDPTPTNNRLNVHGTRCAGVIAAAAGNNHCGVGIAFNASVGGVRMLDGGVSDYVEAAALGLNQQHIDIYTASWGPDDTGAEFDGPGKLAAKTMKHGVEKGRGGLGNIYVWASGNGGIGDSCGADGYVSSIYTLAISSVSSSNGRPAYSEHCAATIASTYSSSTNDRTAITTTDVPDGCTYHHSGTSASAPIAAGVIALALEANPLLTWRDVQHILLRSANPSTLLHNVGWSTNGVGRRVSDVFGYGLIDAEAAVRLAKHWVTVPAAVTCKAKMIPKQIELHGQFKHRLGISIDNTCTIQYVEHVQITLALNYTRHGDLRITLRSPAGTETVLLPPRPRDNTTGLFERRWPLLSVHTWGEDAHGVWTVTVENVGAQQPGDNHGTFDGWSLIVHGTDVPAQPSDPERSMPQKVEHSSVCITQPLPSDIANCSYNNTLVIGMCITSSLLMAMLFLVVAYWLCYVRTQGKMKSDYVAVHVADTV
jgi:subtilisin family serine protease/subtilisin-like proprotein convertase family protein